MFEEMRPPAGDGSDRSASDGVGQAGDDVKTDSWQEMVKEKAARWVEEISSLPEAAYEEDQEADLYSFYEALCALRTEFRKSARRSHETFSRFGDAISEFGKTMEVIYSKVSDLEGERAAEDMLAKKERLLPLVELFERFRRLEGKLNAPPRPRLFSGGRAWKEAWENFRSAFEIVCSHFEELLKREGVTAIDALNCAFDPRCMTAVSVQERNDLEPNTVVDEISKGYLCQGHILKPAEVKVSKGERA